MNIKTILIILLLFPVLCFSQQHTMEVRIPLSKKGYDKLLRTLPKPHEIKKRNDYYLEAFDGESYLLGTEEGSVKFRVKEGSKVRLQLIKLLKSSSHNCGEINLESTVRENYKTILTKQHLRDFKYNFWDGLNKLTKVDTNISKPLDKLRKLLVKNLGQTQKPLFEKIHLSKFTFSPTQFAIKKISLFNFKTSRGVLEVSLRIIEDFDNYNRAHVSYELEVEPEEALLWSENSLAYESCHLLSLDTLEKDDISYIRYQRKEESLSKLKALSSSLEYKYLK